MRGLTFAVEGAEAVRFAASPVIAFRLRITGASSAQPIQSIALRCQIQIETQRRTYTPAERHGLRDLFGEPDRWSLTLRPLLWTHVSITVPEFSGVIAVDVAVPCTFDFNVAAAKYFHAMEEQDIPLAFQFSGTIFYSASDGTMQIAQIDWDKEARFRLPSRIWREMMDLYYPNSTWLRLNRDVFDRLHDYKQSRGVATWDEAIESLLPEMKKEAAS